MFGFLAKTASVSLLRPPALCRAYSKSFRRKPETAVKHEQKHPGDKRFNREKTFLRQKLTDHHDHKSNRRVKKQENLYKNATSRDIEAVKLIIEEVRRRNPRGLCKFVVNGQEKNDMNIYDCCKAVDFSHSGLMIVSSGRKDDRGHSVPSVKEVDQKTARQIYSNHLSELATQSIKQKSPGLVRRQKRIKSVSADIGGEGGEYKVVRVSWQITPNDLSNQKRHEIESQVKKGVPLRIVFDDNDNFDRSLNRRHGNEDDLGDVEATKREKVASFVEELMEAMGAKFDREGTIKDKLMYKVKPVDNKPSKEEKRRLKDEKKKLRQEKLEKRTAEKRAKEAEMKEMRV